MGVLSHLQHARIGSNPKVGRGGGGTLSTPKTDKQKKKNKINK